MTTESHDPKTERLELTTAEKMLIAAVREGDHRRAASALGRLAPPYWSYEQRLAFAVIGRLATEGALSSDTLVSPSAQYIEHLIDAVADTLQEGINILGSVGTLQQILDHASSGMPDGVLDSLNAEGEDES